MVTSLTIPIPEHQRYEQGSQTSTMGRYRRVIEFFYPVRPCPSDRLGNSEHLLHQLAQDMRSLRAGLDGVDILGHLIDTAESQQGMPPYVYRSPARGDFERELRRYLSSHEELITDKIRDIFDTEERSGTSLVPVSSNAIEPVDITGFEGRVDAVVLFAVSGAGKSHTLRHFLSQHFGFYFYSCNLAPTSGPAAVHDARRGSGPIDSVLLGQLIEYAKLLVSGAPLGGTVAEFTRKWFVTLLKCRYSVFWQFISLASRHYSTMSTKLPALWLALQTNSNTAELFERYFQLASWCDFGEDHGNFDVNANYLSHIPTGLDGRLYFCLDESQADLDVFVLKGETWSEPQESKSLLNTWSNAFADFSLNFLGYDSPIGLSVILPIFTGTSLRLQDAVSDIRDIKLLSKLAMRRQTYTEYYNNWDFSLKLHIVRHFPLVGTPGLTALLHEHQVMTAMDHHPNRDEIEQAIIRNGTPLLGRPRWSILYLEEAHRRLVSTTGQSWEHSIQKASHLVAEQVKNDLKQRLQGLYQLTSQPNARNIIDLLRNLCKVVVRNDLLDDGYAFLDDDRSTMVSEGFAVMMGTPNSPKQVLAESLAIKAAKEFFLNRDQTTMRWVDEELGEMIQNQQNDPRALGKTAEWFLAWVGIIYHQLKWLRELTWLCDRAYAEPSTTTITRGCLAP